MQIDAVRVKIERSVFCWIRERPGLEMAVTIYTMQRGSKFGIATACIACR